MVMYSIYAFGDVKHDFFLQILTLQNICHVDKVTNKYIQKRMITDKNE
jgi:hypothetical protein